MTSDLFQRMQLSRLRDGLRRASAQAAFGELPDRADRRPTSPLPTVVLRQCLGRVIDAGLAASI
jgi:hypothetical protein